MIRNRTALGAVVAALAFSTSAIGANWLQLQGNEAPDAKPLTLWGFIQPTYIRNEGGAVTGLTGAPGGTAYNGKTPVFNLVAPNLEHKEELLFTRARVGARGVIPGTDRKINYFLMAEFGRNGLTLERSVVVPDASLTFNYIPGARIRVGVFKLPTAEESYQAIHVLDYINFTNVTDNLMNERFVTTPTLQAGRAYAPLATRSVLSRAQVNGPVGGFRDAGVQVYDWFQHGKWEYAYAVVAGLGNGINWSDSNSKLDLTERLQAAYVFGGKGPRRQDVVAFIWHQEGKRTFGGQDYNRVREGVGAKYRKAPFRVAGEYMRGSGMIFNGPNPPFNDLGGTAFQPVATVALGADNKAHGYYVDFGWSVTPKWELDARYDQLDRLTNSATDERQLTTWTLGGQYFFTPLIRVALNYEIRDINVPNPGAILPVAQRTNAQAIANSIGNRIGAQLTWIF